MVYLYITLISITVAGCAIGPNYHRPKLPLTGEWSDSKDIRFVTRTQDYRDWWKTFNDPVLNNLISKAYKENLNLRIAAMRVIEARSQLGIAVGEIFPMAQASSNLTYNRISANTVSFFPKLDYAQWEVLGQAAWEVDIWGKFRRQVESAKANWMASAADYDNALVSLIADTANLYVNIRTLEKRLEIAKRSVAAQENTFEIIKTRYHYGTANGADLEQARTALNNTLASVPVLEIQLKQSKNALSVLLGMPPSDLSGILSDDGDIPSPPIQALVGIPADLLRRRPDIRSAEYQAMAQCAQIGVTKTDLYPAFSLTGTFGFAASDIGPAKLSDIFQWKSRMYQLGPSVQWNILDFGTIINNVRLQDARFQELLINYQNTVLKAQQEVEDNMIAFLRSHERARLLADAVDASKNALELTMQQYRKGAVDFTVVLNGEQTLLNQQDSLASSIADTANNTINLYRALGGGWELRENKDLIPPEVMREMSKRTRWSGMLRPVIYNPSTP